jgi:hypothetical protein
MSNGLIPATIVTGFVLRPCGCAALHVRCADMSLHRSPSLGDSPSF